MDSSSRESTIYRQRGREAGAKQRVPLTLLAVLCLLLLLPLAALLSNCSVSDTTTNQQVQTRTFTSTSTRPITYSTNPQDVLIRTFYGGGLSGTLAYGPQVSIYGDGSYILGLNQQGKLSTEGLQQLLDTLVNSDGLLDFKRLQFSDVQDQNATFLELDLNGKQGEMMYGPFGNQQETAQDMDEYQRLGKALTTITEALKGPTHPYTGTASALLVRQVFNPDYSQSIPYWDLADISLGAVARYECGTVPQDDTSPNAEGACLKYTVPQHALLLNAEQLQAVKDRLSRQQQEVFTERGLYYTVMLRPLLPDEAAGKLLAMFGSAQGGYKAIPLQEGPVPTTAGP